MAYPESMDSLFGAHWRARLTELRALREERGATDPVLIIAGIAITLILIVGGTFAMSGFMTNAQNLNATSDLDRIATAQAQVAAMRGKEAVAASGKYLYVGGKHLGPYARLMTDPENHPENIPDIDVVLSEGTEVIVFPVSLSAIKGTDISWVAYARSSNGSWFMRASDAPKAWDFGKANYPADDLQTPEGFVGSKLGGVTVTEAMAEQVKSDLRTASHSYYIVGGQ